MHPSGGGGGGRNALEGGGGYQGAHPTPSHCPPPPASPPPPPTGGSPNGVRQGTASCDRHEASGVPRRMGHGPQQRYCPGGTSPTNDDGCCAGSATHEDAVLCRGGYMSTTRCTDCTTRSVCAWDALRDQAPHPRRCGKRDASKARGGDYQRS